MQRRAATDTMTDFGQDFIENVPSNSFFEHRGEAVLRKHLQRKLHYSAQASYFAAFRGIRDTKIEKSRGIQDKISL